MHNSATLIEAFKLQIQADAGKDPESAALGLAVVNLVETLLTDINRTAEALERIENHLKGR